MSPTSPLPAILSVLTALATVALLTMRFGKPTIHARYASLDGLRGYLAFFVFLHHSSIWYFYLRTGRWEIPPSHLYAHFGQSSVAMFFMITGFLFFSKLIDGKTKKIAWDELFISRFLRLVPLYFFAIFLLLVTIAILSHAVLRESPTLLLKSIGCWLSFTILGNPDLNGVPGTATILAGVTWSLPYEWFFYLLLPLIALSLRELPPIPYLLLSIFSGLALFAWELSLPSWIASIGKFGLFLAGISAAIAVRSEAVRRLAKQTSASIICVACIAIAVFFFDKAYRPMPMLLLSIAFCIIACGNTLFGVLTNPLSCALGEMSYSIYLLHGLGLFWTFNFILGSEKAKLLSPEAHWLTIMAITPLLITATFATFRLIEAPAMRKTKAVAQRLRSRGIPISAQRPSAN